MGNCRRLHSSAMQLSVCFLVMQVFYVPNITQGVMDVQSGRVDMAFVRADLLLRLQNQNQLNASDFKTLSPVSHHPCFKISASALAVCR